MQNSINRVLAITVLFLSTMLLLPAAEKTGLDALQGKWIVKKTNEEGQSFTQTIEIKKDKLTFSIAGADGQVRFFAKGVLKAEKLAPFNVVRLSDLEAGGSADDTQPVNDDRVSIYVLEDDKLTIASNFDKVREDQKPALDVYTRAAASPKAGTTNGAKP